VLTVALAETVASLANGTFVVFARHANIAASRWQLRDKVTGGRAAMTAHLAVLTAAAALRRAAAM